MATFRDKWVLTAAQKKQIAKADKGIKMLTEREGGRGKNRVRVRDFRKEFEEKIKEK